MQYCRVEVCHPDFECREVWQMGEASSNPGNGRDHRSENHLPHNVEIGHRVAQHRQSDEATGSVTPLAAKMVECRAVQQVIPLASHGNETLWLLPTGQQADEANTCTSKGGALAVPHGGSKRPSTPRNGCWDCPQLRQPTYAGPVPPRRVGSDSRRDTAFRSKALTRAPTKVLI